MYFFSRKLFFFDHHAIQGENPKVSERPVFFPFEKRPEGGVGKGKGGLGNNPSKKKIK